MAGETLRDAAGLLANLPDNTAGLIDAVNSRDGVVSMAPGIGFLEDDAASFPIVIPDLVTFVNVNAQITPTPILAANFWKIDGNNAWLPSYTDIGVTVPAGVERLVGLDTSMIVQKAGGGTGTYVFQYFQNGVAIGNEQPRLISTVPALEFITIEILYEVANSFPLDLRVRGSDTTDDLNVLDFRQRITGVML